MACAAGELVRAAGEMILDERSVRGVTNQSTGYCPEPSYWPAVFAALAPLRIPVPETWTARHEVRLCACGQINLVKERFGCAVCGPPLPEEWNFGAA